MRQVAPIIKLSNINFSALPTKTKDEALAQAIAAKDEAAIDYIYRLYSPALFGLIKKTLYNQEISCNTLVDAFKMIIENINSYDPSKESLFIWAYRIARKEASKVKVNLVLRQIFNC